MKCRRCVVIEEALELAAQVVGAGRRQNRHHQPSHKEPVLHAPGLPSAGNRHSPDSELSGMIVRLIKAHRNEIRDELIEADHMNNSDLHFDDAIKVTSSGFIRMRVLTERMEYLYGVLVSTPILDRKTAELIAEVVQLEVRYGELTAHQRRAQFRHSVSI
jgi:hypothetical protein